MLYRSIIAVAVTLLLAMGAATLFRLVGARLPFLAEAGLDITAMCAWVAGLSAWFLSRMLAGKERNADEGEAARRGVSPVLAAALLLVSAAAVIVYAGIPFA